MGNTRNEEQNTRILFRFGLFCEYSNLEYVRIHAIYRVNQAGYAIHIPADALLEYVNIYSPRRVIGGSDIEVRLFWASPNQSRHAGLTRAKVG